MRSTLTTATLARLTIALLLVLALPATVRAQEVLEYYGTDALGTVRVVYTPAGTLVARTDLLPFGEPLETTPGGPAEQFTGQERDPEAGQDYFHARMYQPRAGRFTGVDPVYAGLFDPQQWNRYAYARNNPLSFTDATGLQAEADNKKKKCKGGSDFCAETIASSNNPGGADGRGAGSNLWTDIETTFGLMGSDTFFPGYQGPDWEQILMEGHYVGAVITDIQTLFDGDLNEDDGLVLLSAVPGGKSLKGLKGLKALKSIRSLERRLAEHRSKLEAYRANPYAYDNKGILRNAPSPEIRDQIIDGRINHLEREIREFERQIEQLRSGGGGS